MEYFERQLIPKFKEYGSIWSLKGAGVLHAEAGVTNKPSESVNAPSSKMELDIIVVSMYHLCAFYKREIERSMHQCGRSTVQDMYDFCKRDPAYMYMPRQQTVFDPKDIAGQARVDTYARQRNVTIQLTPFGANPLILPIMDRDGRTGSGLHA